MNYDLLSVRYIKDYSSRKGLDDKKGIYNKLSITKNIKLVNFTPIILVHQSYWERNYS